MKAPGRVIAACQAEWEWGDGASMDPVGTDWQQQWFTVIERLDGGPKLEKVDILAPRGLSPGREESAVPKDARAIWIAKPLDASLPDEAGRGYWIGIKALPDTPENRKAVSEALKAAPPGETPAPPVTDATRKAVEILNANTDTLNLSLWPWPCGRQFRLTLLRPRAGVKAELESGLVEVTEGQAKAIIDRLAKAGFFDTAQRNPLKAEWPEGWIWRGVSIGADNMAPWCQPDWEASAKWLGAIRDVMDKPARDVIDDYLADMKWWQGRAAPKSKVAARMIEGTRVRNSAGGLHLDLVYVGPQSVMTTARASVAVDTSGYEGGKELHYAWAAVSEGDAIRVIDLLDAEGMFERGKPTDQWNLDNTTPPHFLVRVTVPEGGPVLEMPMELGKPLWDFLGALRGAVHDTSDRTKVDEVVTYILDHAPPGSRKPLPAAKPAADSAAMVAGALQRIHEKVAALQAKYPVLEGVAKAEPRLPADPGSSGGAAWEFSNNATPWAKNADPKAADPSKPFCCIILSVWPVNPSGPPGQPVMNQKRYEIGGKTWLGYVRAWTDVAGLADEVNAIATDELALVAGTKKEPSTAAPTAPPASKDVQPAARAVDSHEIRELMNRASAVIRAGKDKEIETDPLLREAVDEKTIAGFRRTLDLSNIVLEPVYSDGNARGDETLVLSGPVPVKGTDRQEFMWIVYAAGGLSQSEDRYE